MTRMTTGTSAMEPDGGAPIGNGLYQPAAAAATTRRQRWRNRIPNITKEAQGRLRWKKPLMVPEVAAAATTNSENPNDHHDDVNPPAAQPLGLGAETVPPEGVCGPSVDITDTNSTRANDAAAFSPSTAANGCETVARNERISMDVASVEQHLIEGPDGYLISGHPDHWPSVPNSLEEVPELIRRAYQVFRRLDPEMPREDGKKRPISNVQIRWATKPPPQNSMYILRPCIRIVCSNTRTADRVRRVTAEVVRRCNDEEDPVPILFDLKDRYKLGAGDSSTPASADALGVQPHLRYRVSSPVGLTSACGLTFDAILTEPEYTWVRTSRIGGLLSVKSEVDGVLVERIVGMTTAHGLVELLDRWRRRNSHSVRCGVAGDDESEYDDESDYEDEEEDFEGDSSATSPKDEPPPGKQPDLSQGREANPATDDAFLQVGCWIEVDPVFPMQFGKDQWHDFHHLVLDSDEPESADAWEVEDRIAADFALFAGEDLLLLGNSYRTSEQSKQAVHVETSAGDGAVSGGMAHLLLGPGKTVPCRLLEGRFPLFVGSSTFSTRRVLLDAPLGERLKPPPSPSGLRGPPLVPSIIPTDPVPCSQRRLRRVGRQREQPGRGRTRHLHVRAHRPANARRGRSEKHREGVPEHRRGQGCFPP